jgi:O-antigen/teichoic acid export membrane protein
VRAFAQLFGARILGQTAGFAATLLVARSLAPDEFGRYAFAASAALLLSQIPGAGLDLSAVRLSAPAWRTDPTRARGILWLSVLARAAFGALIIGLGLAFADWLTAHVVQRAEFAEALRVAVVAAACLGLTESMLASLQSQERFGSMFGINVISAKLKLLPVVVLVGLRWLNLDAALLALVAAAVLGCLASTAFALPTLRGPRLIDRVGLGRLVALSPWLAAATMLAALGTNLDVLLLASVAGPQPAGVYASGRALALPFGIAAAAVGAVLLPRLACLEGDSQLRPCASRIARRLTAAAGVTALAVIVLAPVVVGLVYGDAYRDAVAVLRILVLAHALDLVAWPAVDVLLVLDRPWAVAALNGAFLAVAAVGLVVLVPIVGAAGAAWAVLAGRALILVPYALVLLAPPAATRTAARTQAPSVG